MNDFEFNGNIPPPCWFGDIVQDPSDRIGIVTGLEWQREYSNLPGGWYILVTIMGHTSSSRFHQSELKGLNPIISWDFSTDIHSHN